jgi:gluconolactonase
MQIAKSKILEKRQNYRDISDLKSGIEVIDSVFNDYIGNERQATKLWTGCEWAEGPVFLEKNNCVLLSDVPNNRILQYNIKSKITTIFREPSNFSNGNTVDLEGNLITCEHQTNRITRTDDKNKIITLVDNYKGKKLNSPNDVVVKSDGTIWFTDPPYGILSDREGNKRESELNGNYVFKLDPNTKELKIVFDQCDKPNGLAFSPDEKILYVADSGEPENILAIEVNENGTILSNPREFGKVSPGIADGFRIDSLGNIWTSAWDGVHCFSQSGNLLGKIFIPEQRTANLVFGDLNYKTLYIAGDTSLYSIKLNIKGYINK